MAISANVSKKRISLRTHICDLARTSGSNLPRLLPNAKFYNRWKRNFQKLFLVSTKHPLTRMILRSQAAVAFERKRHVRSSHRWVIHPCSILRFYWDTMMTVTFLYIFVTAPYILCFCRIGKSGGVEYWHNVYPAYAICILDIFLNFITGFISSANESFLDIGLVARHYAKGYFFIDFISSVPYTWFYPARILPPGPKSNPALLILEFLSMVKIMRISTVRRNIQQINSIYRIPKTQRIIIWLILLTLLIFHWSSCICFVVPFIVMHILGKPMENSDAYYVSEELYNQPDWKVYLVFVHVGVSNLIGSGFVEIKEFGIVDKTIRCILLLLGKGYTIYFVVTILHLLESSVEPELKYQRIMHEVKRYIQQKQLPHQLGEKLVSYYEHRYRGSFFKENVIRDTLSSHLNQEIILHSSRTLLNNPILRNLSRNVLGDLMDLFKPVIYLDEDVIYTAGVTCDCMYFIANGTIALITFSGKEICHLHDGDHFGETGFISTDRRRLESAMAVEVCELLRLDRYDFKYFLTSHPEFFNKLEQIVQKRSQIIKKMDEEFSNKAS